MSRTGSLHLFRKSRFEIEFSESAEQRRQEVWSMLIRTRLCLAFLVM